MGFYFITEVDPDGTEMNVGSLNGTFKPSHRQNGKRSIYWDLLNVL